MVGWVNVIYLVALLCYGPYNTSGHSPYQVHILLLVLTGNFMNCSLRFIVSLKNSVVPDLDHHCISGSMLYSKEALEFLQSYMLHAQSVFYELFTQDHSLDEKQCDLEPHCFPKRISYLKKVTCWAHLLGRIQYQISISVILTVS